MILNVLIIEQDFLIYNANNAIITRDIFEIANAWITHAFAFVHNLYFTFIRLSDTLLLTDMDTNWQILSICIYVFFYISKFKITNSLEYSLSKLCVVLLKETI